MTKKDLRREIEAQAERIEVQGREIEAAKSEVSATRDEAVEQRRQIGLILRLGARIRHVAHKIADGVQESAEEAGRMMRDR